MNLNKIINGLDLELDKSEKKDIKFRLSRLKKLIEKIIKKKKIDAELFIGGSYAKNTLMKSDKYDIDLFVRFAKKYENISSELKKILSSLGKEFNINTKHGSRDYYQISSGKIIFEIIPVRKIKNPKESENVTDLSYFHVKYLKNKLKGLEKQILITKKFLKANNLYGAESYIEGFSGYSVECLILHYRSFKKMLRELIKVDEKVIIDIEKKYRDKSEIMFSMNESKTQGPIILVDPTWKERNVSSSLSYETFNRFKAISKDFLKRPSLNYFEEKILNVEKIRGLENKRGREFVKVDMVTNKQEGDIAATKMKKFSRYLTENLSKYFDLYFEKFEYVSGKESSLLISGIAKNKVIKNGPPIGMKKEVNIFKKKNSATFEKSGKVYAYEKFERSLSKFIEGFLEKNMKIVKEMDITAVKIIT